MKRAQTIQIDELEAGPLNASPAIEALLCPLRASLSYFRPRLLFVSYEGDGSELCKEMGLREKLYGVALQSAVDGLAARKEVLNAPGTVDGEPFQQIGSEEDDSPPLMRGDLAAAGVEATLAKWLTMKRRFRVTLRLGPLIRRREHNVLYATPVRIGSLPCRALHQLRPLPEPLARMCSSGLKLAKGPGGPSQRCLRSRARYVLAYRGG